MTLRRLVNAFRAVTFDNLEHRKDREVFSHESSRNENNCLTLHANDAIYFNTVETR